jgi:hypothetical protein
MRRHDFCHKADVRMLMKRLVIAAALAMVSACTPGAEVQSVTSGSGAAAGTPTSAPSAEGTAAAATDGTGAAAPEAPAAAPGAADQALNEQMVITVSGGLQTTPATIVADIGSAMTVVGDDVTIILSPSEPISAQGAAFPRLDRFTFNIAGATVGDYALAEGGDTTFQFDINFADTNDRDAFSLRPESGTLTIESVGGGNLRGRFTALAHPTQMNSTEVDYTIEGSFHIAYRE